MHGLAVQMMGDPSMAGNGSVSSMPNKIGTFLVHHPDG